MPSSSSHLAIRRGLRLTAQPWARFVISRAALFGLLALGLAGCDTPASEAAPGSLGVPVPAAPSPAVTQVQALPPKGRDSVQVTSWGFRNLDRASIDALADAGKPPSAGANPTLLSAWTAAGMRLLVIRPEQWQQFVRSVEAAGAADAERPEPSGEPSAEPATAPDAGSAAVKSPRAIIPGPQTWLAESPEWLEVHRGPGLDAGTVLAVADGRFAAPASVPRLLARAFRLGFSGTAQDPGLPPEFVLELVPQLLEVRRPNSDLDLIQPRLRGALERGLTLDRLLTSVRLRAGELLVLIPPIDDPPPSSPGDISPSERFARAVLGNPDSTVGKVRQGDAPLPNRSRSPGPSADALSNAGGGSGITRPEEAGRAPTFGEVLLVGVGQGATRGAGGGKLSRFLAAEREEALRTKERSAAGDAASPDAAPSSNKAPPGSALATPPAAPRLTLRTLIVFQPVLGTEPAVR